MTKDPGSILRGLSVVFLFVTLLTHAAEVTLAWDPNSEPDLQGYRLHYGFGSRKYLSSADVGNVTRNPAVLPFGGETYFFALTAYNTSQLQSDFSNEVTYRPPVKPGSIVATNQLTLLTDGNQTVPIVWNSPVLDRATTVLYVVEPPTHGRITGPVTSLFYEPGPGFTGFDQCRLILADLGENVLKLRISIEFTSLPDPIGDGTTSFHPIEDAYLQGTTRFNDSTLRVEAGRRVSYLKFNVSGLSGPVQTATLRLQENGDTGSGTLRVHRGSHNNWTESNLSTANAPAENGQVGTFTGAVGSGQVLSIDVTPLVTGNGIYSAIIKLDSGGNDIWFGSEESTRKPQLIIQTTGGSIATHALTVNNGSGDGTYPTGTTVNIVAAAAPTGQVFDRWTGDVSNIANVNAASTSITMPSANAAVTATYKSSSGSAFNFQPIEDAYLQGTTRINDGTLKVEAGRRISYLKFNVNGLSGTVQTATLRFQENGDTGSGTLRVHRGSHNNWTESNLSTANAPAENGQVGTFTGAVGSGQVVNVNVTPLITGNGTYSAIIKLDSGGNDIWFGSEESTRKPQLIVQTTGGSTATVTSAVYHGGGSDISGTGEIGNERSQLEILRDPTDGKWLIGWSGSNWVLQEALDPNAPWTDVPPPVSNPYPVTVDGEYRFFRLRARDYSPAH